MDPVEALMTQFNLSGVVVWLLQCAKHSRRLAWLTEYSDALNRVVAVVAAAFTAEGIHAVSSGSLEDGIRIVVTIPALATLVDGASHWLTSILFQELIYRTVKKPA